MTEEIVTKFYIKKSKRRGVWLKQKDFDILNKLLIHGLLTKKQMYYYAESLYGSSKDTLDRKFRRWRDKGILSSKKYGPMGIKKTYYQLGVKGYEILKEYGFEPILNETKLPRNKDHFIGLRDLIIKTLVEADKVKKNIDSYSPYIVEYKRDETQQSVILRPDWILKYDEQYFDVEFDTGSEGHAQIQTKVKQYKELAELRPNEQHHVLLTLIDNADDFFTYIDDEHGVNRNGRVLNLKNVIIKGNAHIYSNLKFTVAQTSRMHLIAKKWLGGIYSINSAEINEQINNVVKLINQNSSINYTIDQSMDVNEFYLPEVKDSLFADGHYRLKAEDGSGEKVMLLKLMREGDVTCLDGLSYLDSLKREGLFKTKVDYIIAVYLTNEEMEMDVVDKLENVLFTSRELLAFEETPFFQNTKEGKGITL